VRRFIEGLRAGSLVLDAELSPGILEYIKSSKFFQKMVEGKPL
jgi:hypothetical protein